MKVVSSPKRGLIAKDFIGSDLEKVPGNDKTLEDEITQVFQKYRGKNAYKKAELSGYCEVVSLLCRQIMGD